jgi:hypothetical protein
MVAPANGSESNTTSDPVDYAILSFCLLVPTVGTIAFFVLLDQVPNERVTLGVATAIYLSSFLLGVLNIKRFKAHHPRGKSWALMAGIALSGISGLVAGGALFLSSAAAALNLH